MGSQSARYVYSRGMRNLSDPDLWTSKRLARRLEVEPSWLDAEAAAGRLPAVTAGDRFLFDPLAVEHVLLARAASCSQNPSPAATRGAAMTYGDHIDRALDLAEQLVAELLALDLHAQAVLVNELFAALVAARQQEPRHET